MWDIKEIIALMENPSQRNIELVTRAFQFAQKAHHGHKRYTGEPYFTHLFETAKILAELKMGPNTIAAGLLHDCMEDVGVTPAEIKKEFGSEILFLVEGVTKLGKLRYQGQDRHIESLRKLFVAISQDIRVIIIKLADRLHNMRTLKHVPRPKQLRIATETLKIYAPIAYRLGIRKLNRELEDISFSFTQPEEYQKTKRLLKQRSAKGAVTTVQSDYRLKGLYSLFRKLDRKSGDIDKIYDIVAIRIFVPSVSDCYKVLGIIHAHWRPLPGRIKDYIAFPKPNGYRSLHTSIFTGDGNIVEIQIRTEKMHREAEYGIASHIDYKEAAKQRGKQELDILRKLAPKKTNLDVFTKHTIVNKDIPHWIQELAESQKMTNDEQEFMDNLTSDFFEDRIFVFTPRGDVIDLPKDSTPIDFAYAIHSDIGNHMFGANVNGKYVALSTSLKNGDIVEVLTKTSAKPSRKWVASAKTTTAKKHIKSALSAKS
jgi:GTP pyrophosphokinase